LEALIRSEEEAEALAAAEKEKANAAKASKEPSDDESSTPKSSKGLIAECGSCKYTIFVAPGRESKFYGAGFKCPECGASKDKFTTKEQ
jgi:rubrerythrin